MQTILELLLSKVKRVSQSVTFLLLETLIHFLSLLRSHQSLMDLSDRVKVCVRELTMVVLVGLVVVIVRVMVMFLHRFVVMLVKIVMHIVVLVHRLIRLIEGVPRVRLDAQEQVFCQLFFKLCFLVVATPRGLAILKMIVNAQPLSVSFLTVLAGWYGHVHSLVVAVTR